MMKQILVWSLLFALFFLYSAETEQKRTIAAVQLERDRAAAKLTELRMNYIQRDYSLRKLHEKILELHRELALALDAKRDIRELNDTLIRLDDELRQLYKSERTK